jgi:hypothetical protein
VETRFLAERGFLTHEPAKLPDGEKATAIVGRPIMNLLAHAAWSAGNFDKIKFTKKELYELGLPSLGFPYSRLRSVTLSMLLPPVFEWSEEGARVDVGDLEMKIDIDDAANVRGSTALRIPVDICHGGSDLRLCSDGTREIDVLDVEFNKLHDFASRETVVTLMRAAARGVVKHVLQRLPAVELRAFTFRDFEGAAVARLEPTVTRIQTVADGWLLEVTLLAR